MALRVEEAQQQAALAAEKGMVLMVDQEMRLANGVRDLPVLLAERLGALRRVVIGLTLAPKSWGGS